jgi:uncharacterized protein (DUF58 family)
VSRWVWRLATHRITRAGHWLLGLTFLLFLFGAISLEIQTFIPFLYACALWGVGGLYAVFSKPRVTVRPRHAGAVTAGETLAVDVEVTSTRRRGLLPAPDLNVLPEFLPPAIDAVPGGGAPVPPLPPGGSARVRLGLLCKARGVYALKGWRVETDFPFGLLNAYRVFKQNVPLIVYPAFRPLTRFSLPAGANSLPGGVALTAHLGDSFEFLGNREFRQGDSVRDIDWRATARQPSGMPVVREWREEFFFRVAVLIDTHQPAPDRRRRRVRPAEREARRAAFERAVSTCAAVADWLARNDYVVDIFAAGPDLYHLTAGRGAAYLDQMLDILACVELAPPGEEPLAKIEPELLSLLGRLTTVVCVFTDYGEGRRAFVQTLREHGVGVRVILTPPEGAPAPALPPGEDAVVLEPAAFAHGGPDEF